MSGLTDLLPPDQILTSPGAMKAYEADAYTVDRSQPAAVVFPRTTEEAAKVVQWCGRNNVPFTPRGAGTGLSGGAMPALGGVVISTKQMTRILEMDIENRALHAQAGAVNLRLTEAVAAHGLHFAPDPSSQSVSTLGGNIAENSGGPHTLKYGVTTQHVLGLTLVTFEGEVISLGGRVAEAPGADFVSLIVGSEGTLGIVTEAWIKLTETPAVVQTATANFPSTRAATDTVAAIIAAGVIPAALEMMDRRILEAVRLAFGLDFPNDTQAMLLIECDGEAAPSEMETALAICRQHGALDTRTAADGTERAQLWKARKKGIGALGRIAPTLVTHDGVIPRSRLPEMLDFVYEEADRAGILVANIFHAGDGNLHPVLCFDEREPGVVEKVILLGEKIIDRCIELGGSLTGEHGVGVEKTSLMKRMFSGTDLRLQTDVKRIFHQSDLVNPCKILPDQKGCVEHMRRWRGAAT